MENSRQTRALNFTICHEQYTPEGGIIRLSRWPEGYVLWYNGRIVWRSWQQDCGVEQPDSSSGS